MADFPVEGDKLVYSDPPYLHSVRKSQRRYRYDYEEADHVALLELVKGLPCSAMVSGASCKIPELEGRRGWLPGSVASRRTVEAAIREFPLFRADDCEQTGDIVDFGTSLSAPPLAKGRRDPGPV